MLKGLFGNLEVWALTKLWTLWTEDWSKETLELIKESIICNTSHLPWREGGTLILRFFFCLKVLDVYCVWPPKKEYFSSQGLDPEHFYCISWQGSLFYCRLNGQKCIKWYKVLFEAINFPDKWSAKNIYSNFFLCKIN